ncbi:MAG: hypothetical protein HC845_15110 [Akkermansiaceae bacterium]|nr:hypothetical protein [Akkermansiaceae bacterium]
MPRQPLPYFVLTIALIGGVGVFVWKKSTAVSPLTQAPPIASPPRVAPPRVAPQSTRLNFLTDIGQPYQARIDQFRSVLSEDCSEPELRYLYQLLENPAPQGELSEHWYVIANDIMTQILAHETDPQRFATTFTGLLSNSNQPEVIRDYAVQYLAEWLNPRSTQATASSLAAPSPQLATQVLQSLVTATMDPALEQSSIPGTSLMMLIDLKRSVNTIDCSEAIAALKPWLTRALRDGSTLSNPVRVSAVSAAGILAPTEFRPLIRQIAYQENGTSSLRLPAIAAIGRAGETEDLPKLRQIATSSPELSYAALGAHDTLSSLLNLGTASSSSQ